MKKRYVVALDQGTTSCRAIIFDHELSIVSTSQKEFSPIYPQPGYVEHNPIEIYATQMGVLKQAMVAADISAEEISGIGITNQRETTVVWDKMTGKPICNAIVWQCRRTAEYCENIKERGLSEYIQQNTGLVVDAYFSATKVAWILDNIPDARSKAESGQLLFGTIDTWLVWKMTEGKVHVTDYTNASRTMMYNIKELCWDQKLLEAFHIPPSMLPKVCNSSEIYGYASIDGVAVPISGIAGDQQAALFGQGCFAPGEAKNTYGTGCFLLMNTGDKQYTSQNGLLSTIAVGMSGKVSYALEGSIFVGGAVVQWLRDQLGVIATAQESEEIALKAPDNAGVYVVPAFTGLGAPHWDMYARGAILGLTRGSTKHHIVRAALESIAYQTYDVLEAMQSDTGIPLSCLNVDGGASANNMLMQFQADMINRPVSRPQIVETTALGAALLAGLAVGFWDDLSQLKERMRSERIFSPAMDESQREKLLSGWKKAVSRASLWEK